MSTALKELLAFAQVKRPPEIYQYFLGTPFSMDEWKKVSSFDDKELVQQLADNHATPCWDAGVTQKNLTAIKFRLDTDGLEKHPDLAPVAAIVGINTNDRVDDAGFLSHVHYDFASKLKQYRTTEETHKRTTQTRLAP